jgi:hypothetical protein
MASVKKKHDSFLIPAEWQSDLRECLDKYEVVCEKLAHHIKEKDKHLSAWYQHNDNIVVNTNAREPISQWLTNTHKDRNPERFAILASSEETREVLHHYNQCSKDFALCYREIRYAIKEVYPTTPESSATVIARSILNTIGSPNLDPERVRRQAYILDRTVNKVRWFFNNEIKTRRRTMEEAVNELILRSQGCIGEDLSMLQSEITRLSSGKYDPNYLVCYIKDAQVRTLRARVWTWDKAESSRDVLTLSGVLPIFCEDFSLTKGQLILPGTMRQKGGGSKSNISENKVSPKLHGWYYYLVQPLKDGEKKVKEGAGKKGANTLKTAIDNLVLIRKKEKGVIKTCGCYTHNKQRMIKVLPPEKRQIQWHKLGLIATSKNSRLLLDEWMAVLPSDELIAAWEKEQVVTERPN